MGGHRRQQSSMSGPAGSGLARTSVVGLFEAAEPPFLPRALDNGPEPMSTRITIVPSEIITTPATPLLEVPDAIPLPDTGGEPADDVFAVKAKLSTFSFGAKPPDRSIAKRPQPLLPSQSRYAFDFSFSSTSPHHSPPTSTVSAPSALNRLSTPFSRPPSLLLTRATPLSFGSPSAPGPSRNSLGPAPGPPSTPPTPGRRRHSHTRSESISLPNLKVGRPSSLGIPSSPSYPSSPCSLASGVEDSKSRLSGPIKGTRLKFEPSGRGAEAEKEKDEYRRKALEKLTGSGQPPPMQEIPNTEISLPDLDDEDMSSTTSSVRPLSGAFTFSLPSSLTLPSLPTLSSSSSPSTQSTSPFSWASHTDDDSSPIERWSGFGQKADETEEDGLGFGMDFVMPVPTMAKRPSLARNLSVLAEVDEEEVSEDQIEPAQDGAPTQHFTPLAKAEEVMATPSPLIAPTPIRLRELHLLSSVSSTPSRQPEPSSFAFPRPTSSTTVVPLSTSPTKGYGAIGRGRPGPRPLSGITGNVSMASDTSSPLTGTTFTTPRSVKRGSRGSSISYKKDGESSQSGSSRDWSIGSKSFFSPPLDGLSSPPQSFGSPKCTGWGSVPRSAGRPSPRPKNLVGLGMENKGSGRVLGEVDEAEEYGEGLPFHFEPDREVGYSSSEMSREGLPWRHGQLELEMERDALKEDADLWRKRCRGLEERLEAERKDATFLRERFRKREYKTFKIGRLSHCSFSWRSHIFRGINASSGPIGILTFSDSRRHSSDSGDERSAFRAYSLS